MSHTDIDAILCVLWILTYTLVLIGTEKYKYPMIHPAAQMIIASLEFAVVFQLIYIGMLGVNHVFISYAFWSFLEIAIIISQIRHGYIRKRHVVLYLVILITVTFIMGYLVVYKGYQLFFTLFNTLVGEIIWLLHIQKKDYPMKPMAFVMFLVKFIADAMSVPVYFGLGSWVESLMGIFIPSVDFLFIHTYFSRIANTEKTTSKSITYFQRGSVKNEKGK